jgi:hypothetical protein
METGRLLFPVMLCGDLIYFVLPGLCLALPSNRGSRTESMPIIKLVLVPRGPRQMLRLSPGTGRNFTLVWRGQGRIRSGPQAETLKYQETEPRRQRTILPQNLPWIGQDAYRACPLGVRISGTPNSGSGHFLRQRFAHFCIWFVFSDPTSASVSLGREHRWDLRRRLGACRCSPRSRVATRYRDPSISPLGNICRQAIETPFKAC